MDGRRTARWSISDKSSVAPVRTLGSARTLATDIPTEAFKSQRYKSVKTHIHLQKTMIRRYRKADQRWRCKGACSRRSHTGYWIDSSQAQLIVYGAIVLNTIFFICLAYLEDSDRDADQRKIDRLIYVSLEFVFLILFTAELVMRCLGAWDAPFANPWNKYDLALILICFVACILTFVKSAANAHRIAVHLMPTLQVLRLGRFVLELRLIIKGILSAMRAVLWSLCLLALVIYFFAVLASNYVGRSSYWEDDETVRTLFGTLPDAMFTLFTFATLEDFADAVRHFMKDGAGGSVVAVSIICFILFTNLSLLNLVTAVMVDSIIDILPKKHSKRLARERAEVVRRLEALFSRLDKDGNRKLSLEEFQDGLAAVEDVEEELNLLQIAAFDVKELFALIDFDDKGVVSVDEFIEGLLRMVPAAASKKELLGVQYDIHKMWNMLGCGQERIIAQLDGSLPARLEASLQHSCLEQMREVERCVQEASARSERLIQDHVDALGEQLLDGQRRIASAVEASGAEALARLEAAVAALPGELANGRRLALDALQDRLLKTLEPLPPLPALEQPSASVALAASAADVSRLGRLIEEVRDSQRQLQDAVTAPTTRQAEATATRRCCSPPGSPAAGLRLRAQPPPPLQAPSDAGPEPEPFSVPPTPAGHGTSAICYEACRPGPPLLSPLPEARTYRGPTPEPAQRPPGAESSRGGRLPQRLQPPPQFQTRPCRDLGPAPVPPTLPPASPSMLVRDLQTLLQSAGALQAEPPGTRAAGSCNARVAGVEHWVRQQGWAGIPFHKLVLHLDRLGVELSVPEQDVLKSSLDQSGNDRLQ